MCNKQQHDHWDVHRCTGCRQTTLTLEEKLHLDLTQLQNAVRNYLYSDNAQRALDANFSGVGLDVVQAVANRKQFDLDRLKILVQFEGE